jgi:hypothetical protein
MLGGRAGLTLGPNDPDVIDIPLSQGTKVGGVVRFEDGVIPAAPLFVVAVPAAPEFVQRIVAKVNSDGTFVLDDVLPAAYSFRVEGLSENLELSAPAGFEGDAPAESTNITLVVRRRGGAQ